MYLHWIPISTHLQAYIMKVKTAVKRVWAPIQWSGSTHADYQQAALLLKRYQRKFGCRHFNQYLRTVIKNGLWETGVEL
jgi:hypothetical protein